MEKRRRKRIPFKPKTDHMQDKTNGKLMEIIADKNSPYWQDAFNELDARMVAAQVKDKKGFDTPPPPPIP